MSFLQAKPVESNSAKLNVLGTLAQELPNWATMRISASGYALNLFKKDPAGKDVMATLVFSKNLSKEIANGTISIPQLKYCQIILGANAQGEQRYYLTLPLELNAGMDCATWLQMQVEAPVRKAFAIKSATAETVGAL